MGELTSGIGKVGDFRKFTFSESEYEIKEIIELPKINLEWTWTTGLCPHCKKRITRNVNHDFYRIELLIKKEISIDEATLSDIVILGDTTDNKRLIFPDEKVNEIFAISQNFKKKIGVK